MVSAKYYTTLDNAMVVEAASSVQIPTTEKGVENVEPESIFRWERVVSQLVVIDDSVYSLADIKKAVEILKSGKGKIMNVSRSSDGVLLFTTFGRYRGVNNKVAIEVAVSPLKRRG